MISNGQKHCSRKKHWVSLHLFNKRIGRKDGYRDWCQGCEKEYRHSVYKYEYNKYMRDWHLNNSYGINSDEKLNMLIMQNFKCLICGRAINLTTGEIDHRHLDGFIRGLICKSCNTGIGCFKENPVFMLKAVWYLIKNSFKR